ncbi:MAG: hypothetical protein JXR40_02290 [Pontiellaceae bacterium]|nr:hypothetical protein [Pontiellaceae bacterium]
MKSKKDRPFSMASVLVMVALCSAFYFLGMWHGSMIRTENTEENLFPIVDDRTSIPEEAPDESDMQQSLEDVPQLTLLERMELESAQKERLMRNISQSLGSPGMSQAIMRDQRVLVENQFDDLIAAYGLNAEEKDYFLDLLTARRMRQEELKIRLMTGLLTEEERESLLQEISAETDALDAEIDWFLNNELDSQYFRYYESTEHERLFVDSINKKLEQADETLDEGVKEQLVAMLFDEITTYQPFSVDFEKDGARVFSEFTPENIDTFLSEMQGLKAPISTRAAQMLPPEQAEILSDSFDDYISYYEQELRTVQQLFNPVP